MSYGYQHKVIDAVASYQGNQPGNENSDGVLSWELLAHAHAHTNTGAACYLISHADIHLPLIIGEAHYYYRSIEITIDS